MTVVISGTNGITNVNGSASAPAETGATTNTGLFFPATNVIGFSNNGAESARLDASGNLGLGVTPSAWSGATGFQVQRGSMYATGNLSGWGANTYLTSAGATDTYIATATATKYFQNVSGDHRWYIAPSGTAGNAITFTQAMTLDASGNLLVGTTTVGSWGANSWGVQTAAGFTVTGHATGTASGTAYAYFDYNNGVVGSITQSGTTNVLYNTSSDYRLKKNIQPIIGALAKVTALKPSSFDWIDDRHDDGFIAHELQVVLPNVVTGDKDAVNDDGTPKYQQVDYARIVPTLTAAIQEQQALIQTLTDRITKLEAK